jgi:hypothetical protein
VSALTSLEEEKRNKCWRLDGGEKFIREIQKFDSESWSLLVTETNLQVP